MNLRCDTSRPPIDAADIHCPGCGQTYETIIGDGNLMPPRHYPAPTAVRNGTVKVGTREAGNQKGLCPVKDATLVRNLLEAQVRAVTA